MTIIANASPSLRFYAEVKDVLLDRGYDSKIMSLYQVRPTRGPWYLGITMVPCGRTGKRTNIELRLDDVSYDGDVVQAGLENLTLYPRDNSEISDNLRRDIESHTASSAYGLGSRDLAHLVADALDSAGIPEK